MPRLAIIDNKKIKQLEDKKIIQGKCPMNRTGAECMYFEGENLLIDEILCTGCGICVKFDNYNAIKIINLPDTENKSVVHQYGKNGFRIFDLPNVTQSGILGIMGRNGIGKSTVINILSNNLQANFGVLENGKMENLEYYKILNDKYKGSSLQNFFIKLKNGEINPAIKIQQIVNIPRIFKGEVKDLLKKIETDEKIILEEAKKLNVDKILNREITKLSGGELQRVAILATLLKSSCNFFVFDEITNYLDIFQRLNVSKNIKEKMENKTCVVIEHDFIVLDYLCDYINIMYGEQSAYGMITKTKAAKNGINDYLKGYVSEENVKFRDRVVSFDKLSVGISQKNEKIVEWDNFKIELGNGDFSLEIEKGAINKSEIIGIIGENGLGKTTFVKHLEKNPINNKIISYKEQLIETTDNLVLAELAGFKNYTDNFYKVFVLKPLRIDSLLEKQIDELSGGELQRFAIAKCLLAEADIYLLDEPTAFLDIEERLSLSKLLKNFFETRKKAGFIIDHDLVFMDYLSDKLMVFLGTPSKNGIGKTPKNLQEAMNTFLKTLNITFRRDLNNKRPRVNKLNSVNDSKQKKSGEYYYV